ncbi:hypothetical protein [Nonomuraea sp. NPDC049480]|uniref:hypothetical protein n=1 Tax=Nonomuraea sp. NPDC049480 TaxID=3364353 RepID=UPI0037BA68A3
MTDVELRSLVEITDQNVRQVMARAALLQDWAGRQLSTLRNTYPAWNIDRERGPAGEVSWTAELRRELTPALVAAGVMSTIRQPDAIALAATLAWQAALLHNGGRSRAGPI